MATSAKSLRRGVVGSPIWKQASGCGVIVDIVLPPAHRNLGIGSAILKDILAEGARSGKRVSIHVEMFNPALALYERLGFRKLREHGVHHFMEWPPESSA